MSYFTHCGICGRVVDTKDPDVERWVPNSGFPRRRVYICPECRPEFKRRMESGKEVSPI